MGATANEQIEVQLKATLLALNSRYMDLSSRLTDDHPMIISLKAKIGQVEKQIADLDKAFAQTQLVVAQQQYDSVKAKEQEINIVYESQRQAAMELNQQLGQYAMLQSSFDQTQKLCDVLDSRIKELSITEDVGALEYKHSRSRKGGRKAFQTAKIAYHGDGAGAGSYARLRACDAA